MLTINQKAITVLFGGNRMVPLSLLWEAWLTFTPGHWPSVSTGLLPANDCVSESLLNRGLL